MVQSSSSSRSRAQDDEMLEWKRGLALSFPRQQTVFLCVMCLLRGVGAPAKCPRPAAGRSRQEAEAAFLQCLCRRTPSARAAARHLPFAPAPPVPPQSPRSSPPPHQPAQSCKDRFASRVPGQQHCFLCCHRSHKNPRSGGHLGRAKKQEGQ